MSLRVVLQSLLSEDGPCPRLRYLSLQGCGIDGSCMKLVGDSFANNKLLTHLNVNENKLGDLGAAFLAQALVNGSGIKTLLLRENA